MNRIHEINNNKKHDNILNKIDKDLFILKIVLFIVILLVLLLLFLT